MPSPLPPGRRPGSPPLELDAATARRMVELCETSPEREACGFVVRRGAALEVLAVPNAVDRYHAADPRAYPATARDAFLMDPRAQLRVHLDLDRSGGEIVAVWHSHVDAGAYLSARDLADAVVDGVQQVPGAEYIVLGMRAGRVTEVRRWRFVDGEAVGAAP